MHINNNFILALIKAVTHYCVKSTWTLWTHTFTYGHISIIHSLHHIHHYNYDDFNLTKRSSTVIKRKKLYPAASKNFLTSSVKFDAVVGPTWTLTRLLCINGVLIHSTLSPALARSPFLPPCKITSHSTHPLPPVCVCVS